MKKIVFVALAAMALMMSSCGSLGIVSYTKAQNYFVYNTVADKPHELVKITNQDDFNNTFGMATRMGKDGMPTEIDFNKEFIIGEILPETDVETTIEPVSLRKTGSNELTLTYSIKRGAKRSYTTKPMFILKVDNKYKNLKLTDKLIEK